MADAIRAWLAMMPRAALQEMGNAITLTPVATGRDYMPAMPWSLVLAIAVQDDRVWDALVQVRQHVCLTDALALGGKK